ncbi:DUF2243 domain-containing protein [Nocardioides sp. CPCC 205120]|uniref:DUF2243 domain-containing protein n=1 Tax=Nocardioides sp. CPCC 205120 TaxID=3406462 RepID=UPI003B501782
MVTHAPDDVERPAVGRDPTYWSTFLLGAAVMAALDEIVFHQLLGWHHFYDAASLRIGLLSDGLLHAAELVALVAGGFLLADAHRRGLAVRAVAVAGFVTGLGAFQMWDGVVDHKVLRLHQVRYGVDLLAYDAAWIGGGLLVLVVGLVLTARAARRRRAEG